MIIITNKILIFAQTNSKYLYIMRKLLLTLLASLALSTPSDAQVSFGDAKIFNDNWLFSLSDDSLAQKQDYNDSKWRKLSLPHDWSVEGQLSPTLASCQGYLPAGTAWYRKHFTWNKNTSNQTDTYIYFEGVYCRSTVYLNGQKLGHRPNGFASFMYDLTPYLKDGDNVLSVRVDHSQQADSRWYTGSGIYRDVYLVTAGKTHFGQWGLGWEALSISNSSAVIKIEETVENASAAKDLSIRATILDADGKEVSKQEMKYNAKDEKQIMKLKIANPHRWDLNTPYLYIIKTELLSEGKVIDKASTRMGLRTLQFDANNGFALNNRNIKVKGVCLHHDAGVLGAVVPYDVWRRRLLNLKEMGANAIRMSHNPQAPVVYDLCDELGLLVMDEASDEWEFPKRKWVSGWNNGKPAFYGTYDFFEEWIDRDVADMVRRDRNHPSVILWSIGNEVDYPNDPYSHPVLDGGNAAINQPMFGGYKPDAPNAERIGKIAKRLVAVVRSIDTSRPTTGALAGVVMSNQTEYPEAVDVVGYNYTENRYITDHKQYPKRIIYGSETGVGYDSWKAVRDNKHIFGQFIWTGTDYLGESGSWPSRGLNTGLLDFGSFKKGRGWFRASLWSEKPMCYIGTYRAYNQNARRRNNNQRNANNNIPLTIEANDTWNYEEGQLVRVVSYTTSNRARLLLNDTIVGEIHEKDAANGIIYWDIPFHAGTLRCEALDAKGNVEITYSITTSRRPYAIKATIIDDYIDNKTSTNAIPDGHVAHVLIQVVDENGVVVKLADNEITCAIQGAGKLLGLEGSNNTDMGNYRDNRQRVHNGQLLAYIQRTGSGPITIRFSSPLLKSAEIH